MRSEEVVPSLRAHHHTTTHYLLVCGVVCWLREEGLSETLHTDLTILTLHRTQALTGSLDPPRVLL